MTDRNAMERLRALLDEHGIKYRYHDMLIRADWESNGFRFIATEAIDDTLQVYTDGLTPEQVVAATLGSKQDASGGTLTAELVREIYEKHWHDLSAEYDMPEASALPEYSYDWQAVADELNAEIGSGTCEMEQIPFMGWKCDTCGTTSRGLYSANGYVPPNYCPRCGKAVRK